MKLAEYITENKATVRNAAKKFGVSKSTVHKDVTERIKEISMTAAKQVKSVLKENKEERLIRGGMATKKKYENKKRG